MPKASNPNEGGATSLETYDWAYTGTRGTPEEAGYVALDEPAAETDNDWNNSVREDLKLLNWEIGDAKSSLSNLDSRLTTAESEIDTLQSDFGSHVHDSRYYTKSQSENRYVNTSGDTISGSLYATQNLSVNSTSDIGRFHVGAASQVDATVAVIDSDGDAGQDDDALLVRGASDPSAITNSDSVLAVKGDGRVGVNTYSPSDDLDVAGSASLRGDVSVSGTLNMNNGPIYGVYGTIEFTSGVGDGLDFRPASDGDHFLWRHDDGLSTPTEYAAQLSSGTGTVWRLMDMTANTQLFAVGTDGTVTTGGGPLDASRSDWLTIPTYTNSDPSPPSDGNVHLWARPDLG